MSWSPSSSILPTRATPLYGVLFLVFATLCLLRVALGNIVLDLVMDYTSNGGIFLEKIHPTLWGFAGVAALLVTNFSIELNDWELRVTRAVMLLSATAAGLLAFGTLSGNAGSLGYMLDTYVAVVAVVLLFAFPPGWRRQIGLIVLVFLIASAALGLAEFATHVRLMPFTEDETAFRPTGLTDHPLEFGQLCSMAMCFVAGMRWPPVRRLAICAFLLIACVASGARMATVGAFFSAFILLLASAGEGLSSRLRARRRTIIALAAILLVPILVGGMVAAGALGRFATDGSDANAMSRIDIYGILSLLSWKDLLLGTDIEAVRKLITERYEYGTIESSLLAMTIEFGVVGAIVFLSVLLRTAWSVARGASLAVKVATVSFFVVALTNNGLSTKSSAIFLILVLGIAFHDEGRTTRPEAPR